MRALKTQTIKLVNTIFEDEDQVKCGWGRMSEYEVVTVCLINVSGTPSIFLSFLTGKRSTLKSERAQAGRFDGG